MSFSRVHNFGLEGGAGQNGLKITIISEPITI